MTEAQRQEILTTFKECILADPRIEIGPVLENDSPEHLGIWIQVAGYWAYLGESYTAALLTAELSDWWIPIRDGKLLDDDREWFETRARLGDCWKEKELRMFKHERRTRLVQNIGIATNDELNSETEN